MTKKECKKLAKEISKYEKILQSDISFEEKKVAKEKIDRMILQPLTIDEMLLIDEFIQELLNKKNS